MASLPPASNWPLAPHHHHQRRRRRLIRSGCSSSTLSPFFFFSSPAAKIQSSAFESFLKPIRASPSDQSLGRQEGEEQEEGGGGGSETPVTDPVKLALARAQAYRKAKTTTGSSRTPSSGAAAYGSGDSAAADGSGTYAEAATEVPAIVKLAMERAKEYKQKKNEETASIDRRADFSSDSEGQEKISSRKSGEGIKKEVTMNSGPKVSSIDFLGLEFSEKKRYRGTPPGLAPLVEPLLDEVFPEVEIIIGDQSKLGDATSTSTMKSKEKDDNMDLYKPKVSTWGVFPRPRNISKMYGGGRTIQPGEVLETAEEKASKEKQSRELIAAYKSKVGLTIDAKVKAECEKALTEGDRLMDLGRLREALPFYEKVMRDLIFQSELHGQAALQWSICQDSLSRPNEAMVMYEKLRSHPNAQVSKRARQFAFSFQAMDMMKVTSSSFPRRTGYEAYFDAFVENKDNYASKEEELEENSLGHTLPYIMFLLSPIMFVLFVALRKSFEL